MASSRLIAAWILAACALAHAQDGPRHRELPEGIVEVDCDPCSGAPADLVVSGDSLFFHADDGINGRELWRMDARGDAAPIWNLGFGHHSAKFANLTPFRDGVAFVAGSHNGAFEAPAAIVFLAGGSNNILTLADSPLPQDKARFAVSGDWLYFDLDLPDTGRELWRSDGTREGTRMVADLTPGPADSLPDGFFGTALHAGGLVFNTMARQAEAGHTLWAVIPPEWAPFPLSVDGELVTGAYFPLTFASFLGGALCNGFNPRLKQSLLWVNGDASERFFLARAGEHVAVNEILTMGGAAYFSGATPTHGAELWQTDGTPEGTRMVKDIWPGPSGSGPHKLTGVNGRLFFVAMDGEHGSELWTSDGTEQGTRLVFDAVPGPMDGDPYQIISFQGQCFFAAEHNEYGEELWRTDGTPEGTLLVKDIHPGRADSEPYYLRVFNDRLYFAANDGSHGEELWSSDGTTEGTRLELDIMKPARREPSSNPQQFTALHGSLYFTADDGTHGRELWRATFDGAERVLDLRPGGESSEIAHLCVFEDALRFDAIGPDGERAHYLSDGTLEGTRPIGPPLGRTPHPSLGELLPEEVRATHVPQPIDPSQWAAYRGDLYFAGFSSDSGWEPWVWRREPNEARLLRDHFNGPAGSFPREFTVSNGHIYYTAEFAPGATALYRIDPANLEVMRVSAQSTNPVAPRTLAPFPGGIVCLITPRVGNPYTILTISTFLPEGQAILPATATENIRHAPRPLCHTGDALYYDLHTPLHGRELWVKPDNTPRPRLVRDIFRSANNR